MHTPAILVVLVGVVAGYSQISNPRTCNKTPRGSLLILLALHQADECHSDSDCLEGGQCCYSGCVKKCTLTDPCEKVICKDGYICQSRETPCQTSPCRLEATCLPAEQVLCPNLVCSTVECQPGFERVRGEDGCLTCQCVQKKDCGSNCNIFCSEGFEQDTNGCPLCSCNPEPENPCSNKSCGLREECRFVQVVCKKAPCLPVATCVAKHLVPYENACSLADRTTVGLPVLTNGTAELNCSSEFCPDNTVCTSMGRDIKRCCWQSTQELVMSPPKQGNCPLMGNNSELTQECQLDGSCPENQKCCFLQTDRNSSRSYGFCTSPIDHADNVVPAECSGFNFIRIFLSLLGYC